MNATLELRYHPEPLGQAAAWLIPGVVAEEWLAEMVAWQSPLAGARLYVVPEAGVLVVLPEGMKLNVAPRAQAYGRLAAHVYLPIEGQLDPPVKDRELMRLLPSLDDVYVWHPVAGLIRYSPSAALAVRDLLLPPEKRPMAWDRGQPGIALNGRLLSIEPDQPFNLSFALQQGGGDIGTQADQIQQLPPSEGERQRKGQGSPAGQAKAAVAKAVAWLTSKMPHNSPTRTWVNGLEDWAQRTLQQYADWLHAARNKELARLMDLLNNEPDEGLKYALPLAGGHRGLGNPGANLVSHDVNFDLRRVGGGGPVDVWDMPLDYQLQMMAKYRELANREIALGRHRRAAYIFAELLGDLHTAAATLADGGHFREAAALYEERLNQPREAAQCLRRGGLWSEAIALYEKLGEHETVGDLHRALEQEEQAVEAYRRAVTLHVQRANHLAAAQLLEQKLQLPDEAYERLMHGWPHSHQAGQCFEEAFRLLARQARHDRALAEVQRLSATAPVLMTTGLARLMSEVAVSYPDARVQHEAADRTRVLAAHSLAAAASVEVTMLTESVRRLAANDRLLARDCQRFNARRQSKITSAPIHFPPAGRLKLIREIRLESCDWKAAVASGDVFYAAGYRESELILVRGKWDGTIDQPLTKSWRVEPAFLGEPILLACDPRPGAETVFVHVHVCSRLPYDRPFPPSDDFDGQVVAGAPPGAGIPTMAMCYTHGHLHMANWPANRDTVIVNIESYVNGGPLAGTRSFDLTSLAPFASLPSLLVREQLVCLAMGQWLLVWDGRAESRLDLVRPIHSLAGSLPHTRTRIVAAFDRGAMLFWGDPSRAQSESFAGDLDSPVVGLTTGGQVVAASRHEIQVYDTRGGKLKFRARQAGLGVDPIAILPTLLGDQFVVAHADGRLLVYRC